MSSQELFNETMKFLSENSENHSVLEQVFGYGDTTKIMRVYTTAELKDMYEDYMKKEAALYKRRDAELAVKWEATTKALRENFTDLDKIRIACENGKYY